MLLCQVRATCSSGVVLVLSDHNDRSSGESDQCRRSDRYRSSRNSSGSSSNNSKSRSGSTTSNKV